MKSAVIIVENTAFTKTDNLSLASSNFYEQIKDSLRLNGYQTFSYSLGEAGTIPNEEATEWLGHDLGAQRLKFAPDTIRTIRGHGRSEEPFDPEHYVLSDRDLNRLLLGSRSRPDFYQAAQPDKIRRYDAQSIVDAWPELGSKYSFLTGAFVGGN